MTDTVSRGFGKKISSLSLCPQVGVPPLEMVSSTPLRAGHFFPTFCAHGSCTTRPRCAKSQGRERREGRESTLQQSRDEHLVAAVKKTLLPIDSAAGAVVATRGFFEAPPASTTATTSFASGLLTGAGLCFLRWLGG